MRFVELTDQHSARIALNPMAIKAVFPVTTMANVGACAVMLDQDAHYVYETFADVLDKIAAATEK